MIRAKDLYTFSEAIPFKDQFDPESAPWEWLPKISSVLKDQEFSPCVSSIPEGVIIKGEVYLDPSVKILGPCYIQGPAWIGPEVEIRPNAFIRGNVIVGRGCVLGNSCEYKNCLLMDNVESAHFNYVGDSILGAGSHLGAGVICANLKLARDEVVIRVGSEKFPTGLRKVGAFLGDGAEVGCNSVLQPGTILGRRSAVISIPFHGYLPEDKIAIGESRVKILPRKF